MAKYNLRLIHVTTKAGSPHSDGNNGWSGLSQEGLVAMLAMATKVEAAVKKAANQGGAIQIVMSSKVDSPDGSAIPPGANDGSTYTGITDHGLSDIQDAMHDLGGSLKKLGRDFANWKDKNKGHGKP